MGGAVRGGRRRGRSGLVLGTEEVMSSVGVKARTARRLTSTNAATSSSSRQPYEIEAYQHMEANEILMRRSRS